MKPYGFYAKPHSEIQLFYEEYEVIRLLDYENMTQEEASVEMGVSRPTLTRIYESARKKVAKSFIEGCAILIEGGQAQFDKSWYGCMGCKSRFNTAKDTKTPALCPICGSSSLENLHA
jgi:predicted DNA-binding protein (UPF0251 family)